MRKGKVKCLIQDFYLSILEITRHFTLHINFFVESINFPFWRNFSTSGKKVINRGDSYRSRNNSVNSSRSRYRVSQKSSFHNLLLKKLFNGPQCIINVFINLMELASWYDFSIDKMMSMPQSPRSSRNGSCRTSRTASPVRSRTTLLSAGSIVQNVEDGVNCPVYRVVMLGKTSQGVPINVPKFL